MPQNPVHSFYAHAQKTPSKPVIANASFEMSYGVAAATVKRLASRLRSVGVTQGSLVAVRARPEIESLLILALLHVGAVSLHGSNPVLRQYAANIDFLMTDDANAMQPRVRTVVIDSDFLQLLASVNPSEDVRELARDDTCRVVFSSGTTGAPKGVAFSLDYLVKRVNSAERNWMPETPFMSLLGLDTVTGFQTLLWAIMRGETYFISSPHAPLNFDTLKKFDVAALKTSPARLNELLDLVEAKGQSLPHLNVVEVAGSLMSARTVNRAIHLLDRVPVYLYGSTEVGTVSRGAARREQPGFVGFIVGDVIAEVVDAAGTPVHPGVSGALRFQKDGIVSGYWNNPTPNGPSVGPQSVEDTRVSLKGFYDGWFYPGDNGVITEQGELLFEGRHDDLVNVEGSKFTLQQLDQWLQNVTVFDDAASFHFPHEDGSPRVGVIFVSPTEISKTVVERVISEFLVGIPVTVIARVDIIPRNSLGKVDKSAIFSKLGLS